MPRPTKLTPDRGDARSRLLQAAFAVVRAKGYAATSVDDLCREAGVTKGAFFHHFRTKDDLGVAAANHWSEVTGALFASAPYHDHADPLERVLGYLDFRKSLLAGEVREFTCLVGTMVQEAYDTAPGIRAACDASISDHAAKIEADLALAIRARGLERTLDARSLALHTQAVLQGAFILAKAKGDAAMVADSIDHLARYLRLILSTPLPKETHDERHDEPRRRRLSPGVRTRARRAA